MLVHVVAGVSPDGQSFVLQLSIAAAVQLMVVVELIVKILLLLHNSRRMVVLLLSHNDWGKRLLMSLACW